jgi:hypothetical protein
MKWYCNNLSTVISHVLDQGSLGRGERRYSDTLLTSMLTVKIVENNKMMIDSLRERRAWVNPPDRKHPQPPIVANKQCIAVNVYGKGKSPASTSLLYIVNKRLHTK